MEKHVVATYGEQDARRVEVRTGGGSAVVTDGDYGPDAAGPTEMVLVALAGCTSMDVASILAKKRQRFDTYEIAVDAEQSEDPPRVFTRIVVEHRVRGDVEAEALRRSIELSASRYCPVSAMLSASVEIEHRYRLERSGADPITAVVVVTGPSTSAAAVAGAVAEA
jgi:putative redox protein